MPSIKVAVIGVGNCASSLVQGVFYYKNNNSSQGLIHDVIGDYVPGDVEFVLGIDVDARKVGKDLGEAIFAAPNNTTVFYKDVPTTGAKVMRGRSMARKTVGRTTKTCSTSTFPSARASAPIRALRWACWASRCWVAWATSRTSRWS